MGNDEYNGHTHHRSSKSNCSLGLRFFLVCGDCPLGLVGYPGYGSTGEGDFPLSHAIGVFYSFHFYPLNSEYSRDWRCSTAQTVEFVARKKFGLN